MALKATKAEVWAVSIDDRSGGVADKLEPLAKAGANFDMVFARRTRRAVASPAQQGSADGEQEGRRVGVRIGEAEVAPDGPHGADPQVAHVALHRRERRPALTQDG